MVPVPISLTSYLQPPFFLLGILFPYVFVLACAGIVLGCVFERAKARFVIVGSAAYWICAFLLAVYFRSAAAFWSMFLVFFAEVTYAVRYVVGKLRKTATSVSLDLRDKMGLMGAVAAVLVGFGLWLTWGAYAPGSFTRLLQGCAIALVVWVLLASGDKPPGFVRFLWKGFVLSFLLTFFLWFVDAWFVVFWVLSSVLWVLGYSFWFQVVAFSLLPVAICVTVYGVSRKPLPAWIILLSIWCVSSYGVFAAYDVWWVVFIFPYLTDPPYFGGGGLIARDMLLVILAFVVALIFTGIYVWLGRALKPITSASGCVHLIKILSVAVPQPMSETL